MKEIDRRILDLIYRGYSKLEKYRMRIRIVVFIVSSVLVITAFATTDTSASKPLALVFGFIWLTVPISYLSYYMLKFVFGATLAMNNYSPPKDDQSTNAA